MKIVNDFPLKKLNSFGLNVTAKHYIELDTFDDAQKFILVNKLKEQMMITIRDYLF